MGFNFIDSDFSSTSIGLIPSKRTSTKLIWQALGCAFIMDLLQVLQMLLLIHQRQRKTKKKIEKPPAFEPIQTTG